MSTASITTVRLGRDLARTHEAEGDDLVPGLPQRREDRGIGDLEAGIGLGDGHQSGQEGDAHDVGSGRGARTKRQAGGGVKGRPGRVANDPLKRIASCPGRAGGRPWSG
jgi:hypothetical protein